jgi:hypothetical protein
VTLVGNGLVTIILSLAGYAIAGLWFLTAVAKLFVPDRVGLWLLPDATGDLTLSLNRHALGAVGHDILGWWIVPMGLTVGGICAFLTYRFDVRHFRRRAVSRAAAQRNSL